MNNESVNFIPIVIIVIFLIYTLYHFKFIELLRVVTLSRDKKWILKNFFSKHFYYFNQLSNNEKEIFIKRSYRLIYNIKIIGRQNFRVTTDIKLFVIAAYVQITFGFKYYNLPKFRTIIVYPDAYNNKITGHKHYGEVNPKGVIVLSWKRLMKGHEIIDDAINLGLHEMAHALMHTIIYNDDHESGLDKYLKEIVRLSFDEIQKIRNHETNFFRSYAGTNIYEFFAIAIENFFEKPEELKGNYPELYLYIVKLLKQDPIRKIYRINSSLIEK